MKRRGVTLIELMAVIGILSIIMATAAALLSSVMRHVGRQRTSYQQVQVGDRLAEQFRRDVHLAEATTIVPRTGAKPAQLSLDLEDDVLIVYSFVERGVERVRQTPEHSQREFFRLPELLDGGFVRIDNAEHGTALLACVCRQVPRGPLGESSGPDAAKEVRYVAVLRKESQRE